MVSHVKSNHDRVFQILPLEFVQSEVLKTSSNVSGPA